MEVRVAAAGQQEGKVTKEKKTKEKETEVERTLAFPLPRPQNLPSAISHLPRAKAVLRHRCGNPGVGPCPIC